MSSEHDGIERQLRVEAQALNAKQTALRIAETLGLQESSSLEFIQSIGEVAVSSQSRIDSICEGLLDLVSALGWRVESTPPPIPGDSNISDAFIFDSNKDDGNYLERLTTAPKKNAGLGVLKTILGEEAETKVRDARISHVVSFIGRVFDRATGLDTPALVMQEQHLTRTELRHLTVGSVIKLRALGETRLAIANRAGYSRPTVSSFENAALTRMQENTTYADAQAMLEEALSRNERVRISFRPRS